MKPGLPGAQQVHGAVMCRRRHDKEGKGSLTFKQVWAATETNRNVWDPTGWTAEKLEWVITWCDMRLTPRLDWTGHETMHFDRL